MIPFTKNCMKNLTYLRKICLWNTKICSHLFFVMLQFHGMAKRSFDFLKDIIKVLKAGRKKQETNNFIVRSFHRCSAIYKILWKTKHGHGSRMMPRLTQQGLQFSFFDNLLLISLDRKIDSQKVQA